MKGKHLFMQKYQKGIKKRMHLPHHIELITNPNILTQGIHSLEELYSRYKIPFVYRKAKSKEGVALASIPRAIDEEESLESLTLQIFSLEELKEFRRTAFHNMSPYDKKMFINGLDTFFGTDPYGEVRDSPNLAKKALILLDEIKEISDKEYQWVTLLEAFVHCSLYPVEEKFGVASRVLCTYNRENIEDFLKEKKRS